MRIVYGKIVKRVGVSRFHPYETSLVFSERPDLTVLQIKPLQRSSRLITLWGLGNEVKSCPQAKFWSTFPVAPKFSLLGLVIGYRSTVLSCPPSLPTRLEWFVQRKPRKPHTADWVAQDFFVNQLIGNLTAATSPAILPRPAFLFSHE